MGRWVETGAAYEFNEHENEFTLVLFDFENDTDKWVFGIFDHCLT